MKDILVFKVVAREGKLQLCVSVKGKSAMGRAYRVINVDDMPGLEYLGKDGFFTGKGRLVTEANKSLASIYETARTLESEYEVTSLKQFMTLWDNQEEAKNLTIGQFVQQIKNDFHFRSNGKLESGGWVIYRTLYNKLCVLHMENIPLRKFGNEEYIMFCQRIRNGEGSTGISYNDKGSHNYKNLSVTLKTVLRKALAKNYTNNVITFDNISRSNMPVVSIDAPMPRLNMPTEEEYCRFIQFNFANSFVSRYTKRWNVIRDIIIMLVETLSRPMDVIAMRKEDIVNGTWIYVPEKFKQYPVEMKRKYAKPIGLTKVAYDIVRKYSRNNHSQYVFPMLQDTFDRAEYSAFYDKVCKINQSINKSLKLFTPLVFEKEVSLYSFRHYAITRAVNMGLNIADVSTLAKTSITQINNTYYERNGIASMSKLEELLN